MSFIEGILWFIGAFSICWGLSLVVRGGLGESVRRWALPAHVTPEKRKKWRPTWRLIALGLAVVALGATSCYASVWVAEYDELRGVNEQSVSAWQVGAAAIATFGLAALVLASLGDRSKGRRRCPRCWYDLSGSTFNNGPTTCPECSRVVKRERDLFRSRRRRWALVTSIVVIAMGVFGAVRMGPGFRTMQLIPDRVLAWWVFQPGESPKWVRDEISTRAGSFSLTAGLKVGAGLNARPFWKRWASQLGQTESVLQDHLDLAAVVQSQMMSHSSDRGGPIPMDRLNAAWQTQGLQLLKRLTSPDPKQRQLAIIVTDDFQMLMTLALMDQPEYKQRPEPKLVPESTERYEPIVIPDDLDAALRATLATDPSILDGLDSLLGWRAYPRFKNELLAINAASGVSQRPRGLAAKIFEAAAAQSEQTRLELIGMLDGSDGTLRRFALVALRFNALLDKKPSIDERVCESLLGIALGGTGPDRGTATSLFLRNTANTPEQAQPLVDQAMTDSLEAQRLLEISAAGYWNPIPVRDYLFEQLSTSEDRDVRLVLASAEQPWIDLNGKIRPVLEQLANDRDPEIAAAAKQSLQNLQDE